MMNLGGAIESFATGTYTVTRRSVSNYGTSGRLKPQTATSSFTIRASIQPMTGRELERLPEAMLTKETLTVYTTSELRVAGEPDTISIEGEPWEVQNVERWNTLGGYFKAVVAKVSR